MSNQMIVSFPGGKQVTASYNGFAINTDQSIKRGGQASAPEPYDLFLASLATCAGIYVLSFCENRGISHEGVRLEQSWERSKEGKIVTIKIDIKVPPSFPEKYHQALVRAASQCAVKKTFENPPEVVTTTVVA
jgi:ribosomal protein S12 methylthiotransferase accessory factor